MTFASTLIWLALDANFKAFSTSPLLSSPWGMVTITEVLAPPPKLPYCNEETHRDRRVTEIAVGGTV